MLLQDSLENSVGTLNGVTYWAPGPSNWTDLELAYQREAHFTLLDTLQFTLLENGSCSTESRKCARRVQRVQQQDVCGS